MDAEGRLAAQNERTFILSESSREEQSPELWWPFELISQLSGENISAVYTAGGGSNSNIWLTIRSNVLNLPVYKMKYVSGAVGAAILAASNTWFKSLTDAVKAMTVIDQEIFPETGLAKKIRRKLL